MEEKKVNNSYYIPNNKTNLLEIIENDSSNKHKNYKFSFITKTINKNIKNKKLNNLLFILIVIYLLSLQTCKEKKIIFVYNDEILLKIKGIGKHKFINSQIIKEINKICSNSTTKIEGQYITLNKEENDIIIEFNSSNKLNSLSQIFQECTNITEINLSNFNSSNIMTMNGMFDSCTSLKSINFGNFITSNVYDMEKMFYKCTNLISLNLSSFDISKVNKIHYMFADCKKLNNLNLSNFIISNKLEFSNLFEGCSSLKFLFFIDLDVNKDNNFNDIFKDTNKDLKICMKNEIKDYFDSKCLSGTNCGNWKDIEKINLDNIFCHTSFLPPIDTGLINNINIDIILRDNLRYCYMTNGEIIIPPTIINKGNDLSLITDNINVGSEKTIYDKSFSDQIENINITLKDTALNDDIKSLILNISDHNVEFISGNLKYQISTISNQNKNSNFTLFDFSSFANCLQTKYGINNIDDLILFKIENNYDGIRIPIIEYEIYTQDGEKLELDKCADYNISYYIPMNLSESELYMMNPESNFYNDRCDKYTSENGTDMTLYDRKNEYNIKNLSLCEYNCTFKEYDFNISRIKCDCKLNAGLNRLDNINQEKLLNQLNANKNTLNLDVMQCTQILSSTEDIKTNPGFYLLIFILIIFIIIFIIFFIKGRKELKKKIDNVINKYFNKENINNKKNIESNKIANNKRKLTNRSRKENKKIKKNNNITKDSKFNMINDKKGKDKKQISSSLNKENIKENVKKLYETDYELNNALYADAKKYDKRSGCTYYCSLLQYKQIFIFTFLNFDDYNSGIIKKYIFFLSFALHYTINALFFNDSNMHQIFLDQGSYNIKYQFPFIFISALLSIIILRLMLIGLILNDKNIFEIKCQPNIIKAKELKKKTLKNMNIKFIIFFVLNLAILILFWFYLTCWNAIYQNTKVYLIKNTFISFGISLVYPFLINIFPVILRMNALKNNKKQYLYKVSKIVQLL